MRALFYTRLERGKVASTDERETNLAEALQIGARAHGDELEIRIASGPRLGCMRSTRAISYAYAASKAAIGFAPRRRWASLGYTLTRDISASGRRTNGSTTGA